jgi:hypothetical protein
MSITFATFKINRLLDANVKMENFFLYLVMTNLEALSQMVKIPQQIF